MIEMKNLVSEIINSLKNLMSNITNAEGRIGELEDKLHNIPFYRRNYRIDLKCTKNEFTLKETKQSFRADLTQVSH